MVLLEFLESRGPSQLPVIPGAYVSLNGIAILAYIVVLVFGSAQESRESRMRVVELQRKSLDNPDNIRYAWDLAAAKLEDYLNRNLSQVKWIFIVAIAVMFCGFAFVLYGVTETLTSGIKPSLVSTGAGIITEFIGVTFMAIYRSTMQQASSYMMVLERINNIGMAVQILGQMPDDSSGLKNSTRAEIVKALAVGEKVTKAPSAALPKSPKQRAQSA